MKMHPKIFVLLVAIITTIDSFAYDCKVNGIYYNFNPKDKTAEVTFSKEPQYTGIVSIPTTITHNNVQYIVTRIGDLAFYNCENLKEVIIPESVVTIGVGAFKYCYNLTKINIPEQVTKIRKETFVNCQALTEINIPDSVTAIEACAFEGCALTSVCIPPSITRIGPRAFSWNKYLTTVTILNPDIKELKGIFEACSSLSELIIPTTLTVSAAELPDTKIIRLTDSEIKELKIQSFHSLDEFVKSEQFDDWQLYYQKRHKAKQYTCSTIQSEISAEIDQWQKKGEFETTAAWKQRVNEITRKQKINSLKSEYALNANEANKAYTKEYNQLKQEYEKAYKEHYEGLINKYYTLKSHLAEKKFAEQTIELNAPYDADNQSFLISTSSTGDILLPVPIAEAPGFKADWNTICNNIKPVFAPDGDDVALNKVIFTHNGKEYVYDSHTEAKYAVADINYNFSPVEISDIDLDGLDIAVNNIPSLPEAQTIGKKAASDAITARKVAPEKKSVTVGDGSAKSDIDRNIPAGSRRNDRTFAFIVANENYRRESAVPFAANDGKIFAEYLKKTLGLPDDNIQLVVDGSLNDIKFGLNKLSQICGAFPGEASVIVYYAGHGIPDEASKDAYLLPVDGYGSDTSTGYSLRELYSLLGAMPSKQTAVFLDACFSGSERSGNMMMSARGVKIKPNAPTVGGNVVVFSATMDDETAYPYEQENHGMFTYFLLKKLQETKGDVSLGELADFIITKVKQASILKNDKIQTPTVKASPAASGWRNLRL